MACQKFEELLFEIVALTKEALGDRSTANLTALASKNAQACTHMLSMEAIRQSHEAGMWREWTEGKGQRKEGIKCSEN
jgi:hypothetical protein